MASNQQSFGGAAFAAVIDRFFAPRTSEPGGPGVKEAPSLAPEPIVAPSPQQPPVWSFPLLPRRPASRPVLPINVMLPLDAVTRDGVVTNPKALSVGFQVRCVGRCSFSGPVRPADCVPTSPRPQALKQAGVEGIMVDIWWGVVERLGPKVYDWSPYKQLLQLVKSAGLKMTACFSFHACGANVGDVYEIPLPSWVLESALQDPDVLFTDQHGYRNPECLSLFADEAPVLAGRTPLQCYGDFMRAFAKEFGDELGSTITEASIGCGPCGELRYPAYPENKRCPAASQWRFPGIGEFQCYDKRALLSLAQAASEAGHLEWGGAGPHDAGGYNDLPHDTGFFRSHAGSWDSAYGQFFLGWYSSQLTDHGERVLRTALDALDARPRGLQLSLKCAGVHWWYMTRSHAAELTAGYCNHRRGEHVPERNGYYPIIHMCARLGVALNFTCVEMRDVEHPWDARCGPEGLLRQVRETAAALGVPVMGENALCRFDRDAYDRVVGNCVGDARLEGSGSGKLVTPKGGTPPMASFTFLRLTPALFDEHNFPSFVAFVRRLREATGQTDGALGSKGANVGAVAPTGPLNSGEETDLPGLVTSGGPNKSQSETITFRF